MALAGATVNIEADGTEFGPELERVINDALDSVVAAAERAAGSVEVEAGAMGDALTSAARQGAQQASAALQAIDWDNLDEAAAAADRMKSALQEARSAQARAAQQANSAESALQQVMDRADATAEEIAAATRRATQAREAHVSATRQAETAEDQYRNAQERANDSSREGASVTGQLGSSLDDMGSKAAAAAVALVGIGTAAEGISGAIERQNIGNKIAAQLGQTTEEAAKYGQMTGDIYAQNFGESMQQVEEAVGAVGSTFGRLSGVGDAEMSKLSQSALTFSSVFGTDVNEAVQTTSQLLVNGLAKDGNQAFDLLTKGFQQVPQAMREELPEILNEYGTNFRALGFDGETSFNVLVSAAQNGKWALDKAGDSLKEFTIRATDGSKASTDAFTSLGLNAGDMASKIAAGGAGAQAALQQTITKILGIKDPAAQAQTAIALFGTPLEDLSVDKIPAFLKSLQGGEGAMNGFKGSTQQMSDTMNNGPGPALERFKRGVQDAIITTFGNAAKFLMDNQGVMWGLVGVLGTLTTAYVVLKGVQIGTNIVTAVSTGLHATNAAAVSGNALALGVFAARQIAAKIATVAMNAASLVARGATIAWAGAQWLLNAAMSANPLGLIVIAIVAVVAIIVVIATKTTWFQDIWAVCWEAIKTAASWAWENVIKPVFDAMVSAFQWIGDAAMWLWQNVMQPVWNGISTLISLWWAGVQIYFNAWKTAIQWVGQAATWLWQNVMVPVWNGILAVVRLFWTGVQVIIGWIVGGWNRVADGAKLMWRGLSVVFDTIKGAISGVASWIGDKVGAIWGFFSGLPGKIKSIAGNIFEPIKDAGKSVFNAIARLWNNTLGKISFEVPSWVPGMGGKGFSFPKIPEMKRGGLLPGGTSPNKDDIPLLGARGEYMVRAAAVAKYGLPFLEALNSGDLRVFGYQSGGAVGSAPSSGGFSGGGGDAMTQMVALLTQIALNTDPSMGGAAADPGVAVGAGGGDLAAGGAQAVADGWAASGAAIDSTKTGVIDPAMTGLQAGVAAYGLQTQTQLGTVVDPAWSASATNLLNTKVAVIDPTMAGINMGVNNTALLTQTAVATRINPAWVSAGANVANVYNGTVNPTLAAMRGAVDNTAAAFGVGASNIAAQWNRVREATASPVRFAIGSVFNDGIVGMWNSVSDLLGTTRMNPYPIRFATGGSVPGSGNGDTVPALLTPKEFVVPKHMAAAIGGGNLDRGLAMLDTVRKRGPVSGLGAEGLFSGVVQKFSGGGPVKGSPAWNAIKRGMGFAARYNGRPYVWGGSLGPDGGTDCSGYMSSIADVVYGGSGLHRQWATGAFPGGGNAQGKFVNVGGQNWAGGLSAGMSIGVSDVHTAGTIGGFAGLPAVNIESGGSHGNVAYGGPAVGADHSQFPSRYHLPVVNEMFISGGGSNGGQDMGSLVSAITGDAWKGITAKANSWKGGGHIGQYPAKLAAKMQTVTQAKIDKLLEEMMADPGGSGAERWRPMAKRAMLRVGFDASNAAQVNAMIAQIQSESGGNPGIAQQIHDVNGSGESAGVGLLQIIPGTWAAFRDPALPDDRRNPFANMVGALRYYKSQYGMDLTKMWGHGHGYDLGGLAKTVGLMPKFTNEAERVLNPSQTRAFEAWMDAGGFNGDTFVMGDREAENLVNRVMESMHSTGFADSPDVQFRKNSAWGGSGGGATKTILVNQYITGGSAQENADEVKDRLLELI